MTHAAARLLAILLPLALAPGALAQDVRARVPMSDGVELATDVFLPSGPGPFPAILYRTPYDKTGMAANARAVTDAAPVAVVVQDTRGRFASGGVDCVFRCEVEGTLHDGDETIAWVRAQGWSNGVVVTDGGSALGIVQYLQATHAPSGLAAMSVTVATPSLYDHIFFPGGVFRQALVEGWLEAQGSTFFLADVRAHPLLDAFWEPVQTEDRFGRVDVPALHIGGWYDIFTQGTLDAFVGYQHHGGPGARGRQKLVMGPWTHGAVGSAGMQGQLRYPANAAAPPEPGDLWTTWMAHYLGVIPDRAAIDAMPAVQYYVMGDVDDPSAPGNEWRSADDWPIPASPTRWHLQAGGGLDERCPAAGGPPSTYTYDPADPSPTVGGGNLLLPAGPMDQAEVEARHDLALFQTPPLASPLEITGRVRAHLFVSVDAVDTDVMVRLMDVYPDGRSMLVMDGAARLATREDPTRLAPLTPGEVVEVDVDLWSTSIILAPGHRLRVAVSSSNAPRFRPNPNDGSSYGEAATPVVAHVTIHHEPGRASYVELPDPRRAVEDYVRCDAPAPTPDGGVARDAGLARDGGVAPDAGLAHDGGAASDAGGDGPDAGGATLSSGCACRAGTLGGRPGPLALLLGLVGALAFARRRRAG